MSNNTEQQNEMSLKEFLALKESFKQRALAAINVSEHIDVLKTDNVEQLPEPSVTEVTRSQLDDELQDMSYEIIRHHQHRRNLDLARERRRVRVSALYY